MEDATLDFVWKAAPVGFVGMWASIGVVAAVILVRLRDGDFGFRVGAGLFAIGSAAIMLMCAQLRPSQQPADRTHVESVVAKANVYRAGMPLQMHGFVVHGSVVRCEVADGCQFQMALERGGVSVLGARYDTLPRARR